MGQVILVTVDLRLEMGPQRRQVTLAVPENGVVRVHVEGVGTWCIDMF